MHALGINRFLRSVSFVTLSMLTVVAVSHPANLAAQELPKGPNQAKPIDPNDPNVLRPGTNAETGILSMQAGQRLLQEANSAVASQNYPLAVKKLQEARQIFNQLSNFYQDLAGSFSGIENRIAESQRRKALETAQMRDDATYQLALLHRAQNQPELAVPLLIQIIRSQQPTRDLGKKAYQQLFELGFVDSPFPRPRADQSPPAANR
jgi:tetratricopeptide (TPR) repeat protein